MAKDETQQVTKSGITTDADGTRHIPSSIRADGSVRKEIKIRPGYRPPEDIEKYKNRTAEAFRNKANTGVVGAELVDDGKRSEQSLPRAAISSPSSTSAAASKNAKRREARKKAAADKKDNDTGGENGKELNGINKDDKTELDVDPEVERQKEGRKLLKKLRQAKELKDKKDSGAALLPEQFEKVIRINELIRQLDALGFDGEGEKKIPAGIEIKSEET